MVLRTLFPNNYIKIKNTTVVVKRKWYSFNKNVIDITELVDKILPQHMAITMKSSKNFVSSMKREKSLDKKVEILYNRQINLSEETIAEISNAIMGQNKNFILLHDRSVTLPMWKLLLKKFKDSKPKPKRLELLPSTVIIPAQNKLLEEKMEISKQYRHGKITILAEEIKEDITILQDLEVS
jgi:hypothetical protein